MDAFLARDLGNLDLAALMIDGVHFTDHVILVALGIDAEGHKHVLGLWEGATENAAAVEKLLADLVGRGLRTDRSLLAVNGSAEEIRQNSGRSISLTAWSLSAADDGRGSRGRQRPSLLSRSSISQRSRASSIGSAGGWCWRALFRVVLKPTDTRSPTTRRCTA